jgi:hypothetical protein
MRASTPIRTAAHVGARRGVHPAPPEPTDRSGATRSVRRMSLIVPRLPGCPSRQPESRLPTWTARQLPHTAARGRPSADGRDRQLHGRMSCSQAEDHRPIARAIKGPLPALVGRCINTFTPSQSVQPST